MIKNFLVLVLCTLSFQTVFAETSYSMPGIEVGFKLNTMDGTNSTSNKQSQAFQAGGTLVINLLQGEASQFGLKTGLYYSERSFDVTTGATNTTGKITYADVPVHFMYKLEDYAGIYFGPSFSMKMGDNCSNCGTGLQNVKSMVTPLTFGAQFKFAPNFGLNLFFETVSGEVATGLNNSRALGTNLLITFN